MGRVPAVDPRQGLGTGRPFIYKAWEALGRKERYRPGERGKSGKRASHHPATGWLNLSPIAVLWEMACRYHLVCYSHLSPCIMGFSGELCWLALSSKRGASTGLEL